MMGPDEREPPVARPPIDEGEILAISREDAADICAEVYCYAVQYPALDRADSEELATYVYDLLTGEWSDELDSE